MKLAPQEQIYQILQQNKRISNKELSQLCQISLPTVRKFVDILVSENKATHIYGGVQFCEGATLHHKQELLSIAKAAVGTLSDGDSIFLGPGKTVAYMSDYLDTFQHLTVFTNSLYVIKKLADSSNLTLIVIGGIFQKETKSFSLLSQEQFPSLNSSKIFISGAGINPKRGIYHSIPANRYTEEIFASQAQYVTLLADHSKFGLEKPFVLMSMEYIDTVITSKGINQKYIDELNEIGMNTVIT